MKRQIKNTGISGVSLIEIMISVVIVAVLLTTMMTLFPRMTGRSKALQEEDQAKLIATEALEGVQAISREVNCGALHGSDELNDLLERFDAVEIGSATYSIGPNDFEFNCGGAIKTVQLKVRWEKSGKRDSVKVVGAIYE